MTKTTKFYLNKANYTAEDDNGNRTTLEIDYWNNKFKISRRDRELEKFAAKLLKKKHGVNFAFKVIE